MVINLDICLVFWFCALFLCGYVWCVRAQISGHVLVAVCIMSTLLNLTWERNIEQMKQMKKCTHETELTPK